jgi:hypothetical protein
VEDCGRREMATFGGSAADGRLRDAMWLNAVRGKWEGRVRVRNCSP